MALILVQHFLATDTTLLQTYACVPPSPLPLLFPAAIMTIAAIARYCSSSDSNGDGKYAKVVGARERSMTAIRNGL